MDDQTREKFVMGTRRAAVTRKIHSQGRLYPPLYQLASILFDKMQGNPELFPRLPTSKNNKAKTIHAIGNIITAKSYSAMMMAPSSSLLWLLWSNSLRCQVQMVCVHVFWHEGSEVDITSKGKLWSEKHHLGLCGQHVHVLPREYNHVWLMTTLHMWRSWQKIIHNQNLCFSYKGPFEVLFLLPLQNSTSK